MKHKSVSVTACFQPHKMIRPLFIIEEEIEHTITKIYNIRQEAKKGSLIYIFLVEINHKPLELYFDTMTHIWSIESDLVL